MSTSEFQARTDAAIADRSQLLQALRVVRDHWLLVVLLIACLTGAGLAKALTETKQYQATALLVYNPGQSNTAFLTDRGLSSAQQPAVDPQTAAVGRATLQRLATTARVRNIVQASMGRVPESVAATVDQTTNVVSLAVTSPDPQRAATVVNNWARAFTQTRAEDQRASYASAIGLVQNQINSQHLAPATVAQLQSQLRTLQVLAALQQSDVRFVQPAAVPKTPVSPKPVVDGVLGALAGLFLALLVLSVLHLVDRRLKTIEDTERAWGAPLLATIPPTNLGEARIGSNHAVRAGFDHLQASLSLSQVGRQPRILAVMSAVAGEGKTTTAVGLAGSLARNGRRVLLLDADFRRGSLSTQLRIKDRPGLSTVLAGRGSVDQLRVQVPVEASHGDLSERTLDVLGCGPTPPNPYEFFSSTAMNDLLALLRGKWDYIVLDCAPLLPVSDSVPLVSKVEGIIVSARLYHSRSDAVQRAAQLLERAGATVLGLAAAVPGSEATAGYGYGYGYGYGPAPHENGAGDPTLLTPVESR